MWIHPQTLEITVHERCENLSRKPCRYHSTRTAQESILKPFRSCRLNFETLPVMQNELLNPSCYADWTSIPWFLSELERVYTTRLTSGRQCTYVTWPICSLGWERQSTVCPNSASDAMSNVSKPLEWTETWQTLVATCVHTMQPWVWYGTCTI